MAWVINFCAYFIGYLILLSFQHLRTKGWSGVYNFFCCFSIYLNVVSSLISYRYAGSVLRIFKEVEILHILLTAPCSAVALTPICKCETYSTIDQWLNGYLKVSLPPLIVWCWLKMFYRLILYNSIAGATNLPCDALLKMLYIYFITPLQIQNTN